MQHDGGATTLINVRNRMCRRKFIHPVRTAKEHSIFYHRFYLGFAIVNRHEWDKVLRWKYIIDQRLNCWFPNGWNCNRMCICNVRAIDVYIVQHAPQEIQWTYLLLKCAEVFRKKLPNVEQNHVNVTQHLF